MVEVLFVFFGYLLCDVLLGLSRGTSCGGIGTGNGSLYNGGVCFLGMSFILIKITGSAMPVTPRSTAAFCK